MLDASAASSVLLLLLLESAVRQEIKMLLSSLVAVMGRCDGMEYCVPVRGSQQARGNCCCRAILRGFRLDLLPFVGEEDGVVLRLVVSAAAVGKLDKQRRAYLVGRFPRCEAISVFVRKTEEKAHNLLRYAIGRFSRLC